MTKTEITCDKCRAEIAAGRVKLVVVCGEGARAGRDMIDLKESAGRRYRIVLDPSAEIDGSREERLWFYRIPCKAGFIGVHGENTLMAYCYRLRRLPGLLAIPGDRVRQRGDKEVNVVFPVECIDAVAEVLGARRRRQLSETAKAKAVGNLRPFPRRGKESIPASE
jgi:hypothetical protein